MNESIRALQRKSLEIYQYFEQFCLEHDLLYFVCGGGCIGAIRHQGFIPWDDDLDFFMPRSDYEKLSDLWEEHGDHERYTLCRTNESINYHDCGTLLKDNNTTFINAHSADEDIHHGYMIDIIPLDGYAPTKIGRLKQVFFASLFSLFNAQRVPDNQGKVAKILAPMILSLVPSRKAKYRLWRYAEKKMSKYNFYNSDYITELVTGFRYMMNKYPSDIFSEQKWVPFEDRKVPVPVGYHFYLSMAFGDYMQLPPDSQRRPKHKVAFMDMDNPYYKYKGIWYCKNE